MKFEIPDKIRVVMVVTERIGIPTIICIAFAYVYFTRLQKVIDDLAVVRQEISSNTLKRDHDIDEIKRSIRRLRER